MLQVELSSSSGSKVFLRVNEKESTPAKAAVDAWEGEQYLYCHEFNLQRDPERIWYAEQLNESQPHIRIDDVAGKLLDLLKLLKSPPAEAAKPPEDDRPLAYREFPLHLLPEPFASYARAAAESMRCDPVFVVLPMLVTIGAAIGLTRRVRLKRKWREYCILWAALVSPPGTIKTAALRSATDALRQKQNEAESEYIRAKSRHRDHQMDYEIALAETKKARAEGRKMQYPDPPEAPVQQRYFCDDTTVEAVARLLAEQPRGLMMVKDELAGFFKSMNSYRSGGAGSDEQRYLSMHTGEELLIDRKNSEIPFVHVKSAGLWLYGGIQPGTLLRNIGQDRIENGMMARFIFSMPMRRPKQWSEADIPEELERRVAAAIHRLTELDFDRSDPENPRPIDVELSAESLAEYVAFYNAHNKEADAFEVDGLRAAWAKLEATAARLSLLLHMARNAALKADEAPAARIEVQTMRDAITMTRWFAHEARRVNTLVSQGELPGDDRRRPEALFLADYIAERGGKMTPRELKKNLRRRFESPEAAEEAMDLVKQFGLGEWVEEAAPTAQGPNARAKRYLRIFGETEERLIAAMTALNIPDPIARGIAEEQPELTAAMIRDLAGRVPKTGIEKPPAYLAAVIRSGGPDLVAAARKRRDAAAAKVAEADGRRQEAEAARAAAAAIQSDVDALRELPDDALERLKERYLATLGPESRRFLAKQSPKHPLLLPLLVDLHRNTVRTP